MAPSRSITRRLRSFAALDGPQRWLIIEAALWLTAARLALLLVSFPKLARLLGTLVPPADARVAVAAAPGSEDAAGNAVRVRRAIQTAVRNLPFKAVCLPQAMAGQAMLRRRGVACVMHFGAGPGETKSLESHAWLDAAGVEVTGYPVGPHLAEIACFV